MSDHTTRRDFLRVVTTAVGGALVGAAAACRPTDSGDAAAADEQGSDTAGSSRAIGLQLYTVRSLMQRDVDGTLAAIAGIGYREVEFAGYFDRDPRQLRATLDRLSLAAPSTHLALEALRGDLAGSLDVAEILGHRWIVCPYVPESERTLAGYRALAAEFDRWGAACRARGMRFAYHNHDFEFERVEGMMPFDLLLAETDPANVAIEMDLFWTTMGRADSLAYFERHPGRFPLWHVKDMRDLAGAREMVAVGEGEIDFAAIFARAQQAGLEHFFVEHDQPSDPLASVRTSHDNLRRLLS